jgi:peptide/nickel transport system permease protein
MTLIAASLYLFSTIEVGTTFAGLLPSFLLLGAGIGLTMSPMSTAAMNSVVTAKAGVASGILSMFRMIGGTFGVALLGALFQDQARARLNETISDTALTPDQRGDLARSLAGGVPDVQGLTPDQMARLTAASHDAFVYGLTHAMVLSVVVAVIGVIVAFLLIHLVPGDPVDSLLTVGSPPEQRQILTERYGLDKPLVVQYGIWIWGVLQGDLGTAIIMRRPVADLMADALPHSIALGASAFIFYTIVGVTLGVTAALFRDRWPDRVIMTGVLFGSTLPSFWLGLLLMLVFSVWLGWLPATGYTPLSDVGFLGWAKHLILPISTLVLGLIAHVSRLTRSSMLEAIESKYVLAARAKGLPERIVLRRHALPNALLPTITILAVDVGILIGGIVVVESVFAFPGLGRMLIYAIDHQDIPLMMGGMIVITAIYALANLAADILYAVLNPRIRVSGTAA